MLDSQQIDKQLTALKLKHRPSQMQMLELAYDALKQKKIACIEAPTGVGKTLAYGLAVCLAREKKQKIIISTATIALQEQLIKSDIPLVEKVLQCKIEAGLAKGRRCYVCMARLYRNEELKPTLLKTIQESFEAKIWNGEKDSLDVQLHEGEWSQISTDQSGCSGSKCEFYEECVFYRRKRKTLAADVIIVNHSLLLADLSLGGGVVLPPIEDCIYIIDECHHLPEKALSHFAKQAAVIRSLDWVNTYSKALTSVGLYLSETQFQAEKIHENLRKLAEELSLLRASIEMQAPDFKKDIRRFDDADALQFKDLASAVMDSSKALGNQALILIEKLEEKYNHEKNINQEKASAIATLISRLGFVEERLQNLFLSWHLFLKPRAKGEAPFAKWLERKPARSDEPVDYTCHAAPIHAGHDLYQLFWQRIVHGAVLCSATVTSLGNFKDYMRRSGLKFYENVITAKLDSSFDYSRSILYVPSMQFEPVWKNADKHIEETAELLPKLFIKNAGNLVLFTSKMAMEKVFSALPDSYMKKILVQGAQGKQKLLNLHRRRIDKGETSIIFGLASFAEGLDLPGKYCEHLILHKLPFLAPENPIELTRNEWIKQNGLDAFNLYSLPNAALRLTQYIGRLLRTEEDRGVVTILDKRLQTKQYGKKLLSNLPGFKQVINIPVVQFRIDYTSEVEFLES